MHVAPGAASTPLLHLNLRQATQPRVLVCGDADFAYSSALARALRERGVDARLFASAYEDRALLLERYPSAAGAAGALAGAGADVRFGVDARALRDHYGDGARFERVVFNLPQAPPEPGRRNQIQRHRALLRAFCTSAASVLAPGGQLWVTLLAGQGGTPLDPIPRPPGDTWQIQLAAAEGGLLVTGAHPADIDALAARGYVPTGRTAGAVPVGEARKRKGMLVHVLERAGGPGVEAVGDLEWSFENSFWVADGAGAAALGPVARDALPGDWSRAFVGAVAVDSYDPGDGRTAVSLRFTFRSRRLPLTRARALQLNAALCRAAAAAGLEARYPGAYADLPGLAGVQRDGAPADAAGALPDEGPRPEG